MPSWRITLVTNRAPDARVRVLVGVADALSGRQHGTEPFGDLVADRIG